MVIITLFQSVVYSYFKKAQKTSAASAAEVIYCLFLITPEHMA
ncbi:hypothetical protein CLOHYLEM_07407 [[Clostridium] hylemonae DSM 15053]|uniref:Uncharacterized protein n=1 Tax=[Clostridium] hylemonae DSM 15053 TaxID=553973 RepID=C0C5M0_9FIRM|nr:hypothetical protein CLOHYLEM_07407 [[Clostridium] hylemonae DSM 15053]